MNTGQSHDSQINGCMTYVLVLICTEYHLGLSTRHIINLDVSVNSGAPEAL
jgi:hypothetical protein